MFSIRLFSLVLLLLTLVSALPTPTTRDIDEALAERWHQDHKRYHPATGENARPSPSASGYKKRVIPQKPLTNLPLGALEDLARCPAAQMACPITPLTHAQLTSATLDTPFECILPQEDLYSCGGCATLGTGMDCTSIPGVESVSCAIGTCNVHSCQAGYTISSDGHSCDPILEL